jgi:predicted dehydrogenase
LQAEIRFREEMMRGPILSSVYFLTSLLASTLLFALTPVAQADSVKPMRLGIIGLDTSHCIEFTKIFNDPINPEHIPGFRVVAAYKGGSPDIDASRNRIEGFTAELRDKWKIKIVDDIPTLCTMVDAVLEESLDGRVHLAELRPVLAAGKPVFIDKPMADSYHDASEIARLARQAGVPWFSSSSLRFWEETQRLKVAPEAGGIVGCDVYGPCPIQPQQPDLMWYGVHAIETLYTILGPGCETVTRVKTTDTDVVIGKWRDGRIGVIRGIRKGTHDYGITLYGTKTVLRSGSHIETYGPLLDQIAKFFRTRVPPVNPEETLEIIAFMEAADISKTRGGCPVQLSEVMK